MVPRAHVQLLSRADGAPGSAGFKLTGVAKDGSGMCRVWLRRSDDEHRPWNRYLDPRFRSDDWDVRCYTRTDSAFSLVEDFSPESLDALAEDYDFPEAASAIGALKTNGDSVHDTVLGWARRAVGAATTAAAPAPAVEAAPAEEPAAEAAPAEEPAAEAAPAEAPAAEAAPAEAPAPAPTPEPAAIDVLPTDDEVTDAWDAIAEMAERATGAHESVSKDD